MGILMHILKGKIFDADMWGATKEEKDLLFAIERALFTHEGSIAISLGITLTSS